MRKWWSIHVYIYPFYIYSKTATVQSTVLKVTPTHHLKAICGAACVCACICGPFHRYLVHILSFIHEKKETNRRHKKHELSEIHRASNCERVVDADRRNNISFVLYLFMNGEQYTTKTIGREERQFFARNSIRKGESKQLKEIFWTTTTTTTVSRFSFFFRFLRISQAQRSAIRIASNVELTAH